MIRNLLFLLLFISSAQAQVQTASKYRITMTDPKHHLAQVEITFPHVSTKTLEVQLPVWRSGRYEILNLSKHISQLTAQHANGQHITWHKTNKNTWKLFLKQPGSVTVNYQIYANSLKQRVSHIDETHAFLDASGVFMYAPEFRHQPLTVELQVPEMWQSRSGLESESEHTFSASNYDQLVDSPIESGIHEFLAFTVDDKAYEIVIWGEGNHDIQDIKEQVTLLHFEAKKIWGSMPFDRYVYMYHVGDGLRGATEHVNSTIIQQDRFNFKPRKSYLKVLATTAHEFVHTWNVKAYRPAGIAPYDYSNENYSSLFWMAEGITSYYDDLLLLRSGIYESKEYHEKLAEGIHKHVSNPGRKKQSLAQSSFDTWLKNDVQQTHNYSVSIYLEGSLMAWRLDQEIRQLTNNKYGMDELQRRLYAKHSNIDKGYDKSAVLTLLNEITEHDFTDFWHRYIEGAEAIDFTQLLDFYGLQQVTKETEYTQAWIGIDLNMDHDLVSIKTIDSDSPAWKAGLTAGDEILAIDGIKVSASNIENRIHQMTADQIYQVHYFHDGKLLKTNIKPINNPNPEFDIKAVEKPSRKQKSRYKSWTGQDLN